MAGSTRSTNLPLNAFLPSGRGISWPFRVNQFNHFFHCQAQLGINLCFVVPVNAAQHQFGATANEALVFVAPLDEFGVSCGLFFDLLACHTLSLIQRVQRPPHVSFLVLKGM